MILIDIQDISDFGHPGSVRKLIVDTWHLGFGNYDMMNSIENLHHVNYIVSIFVLKYTTWHGTGRKCIFGTHIAILTLTLILNILASLACS